MGDEPLFYLPHGLSFRFVDIVLEFVPGKKVVTIKNISANDPSIRGDGTSATAVPNLILIEAMCQSAGLLLPKGSRAYLAAVNDLRLLDPVQPGDQVVLEAVPLFGVGNLQKFRVNAMVGEKISAEGEFVLGIVE